MPTLISKPRFILRAKTEPLPDEYRIATRSDVATFKGFLFEAMPEWETACLTNGWVDGCECGGNTGYISAALLCGGLGLSAVVASKEAVMLAASI